MFGHQDNTQPADSQATVGMDQDANNITDDATISNQPDTNEPLLPAESVDNNEQPNQVMETDSSMGDDKPNNDVTEPESDNQPTTTNPLTDNGDDLLDIKQQALSQLSPIVDHLDQNAEDKFRTLMMMIQASDNQHLIKEAYAAAQDIPDEKAKAQALLDVVNEINYFTHQGTQADS